eukprot:1191976-Prorocentrum_minimum.AAC.9
MSVSSPTPQSRRLRRARSQTLKDVTQSSHHTPREARRRDTIITPYSVSDHDEHEGAPATTRVT